jgi:quercetin dioxygenase-like cupin family protein
MRVEHARACWRWDAACATTAGPRTRGTPSGRRSRSPRAAARGPGGGGALGARGRGGATAHGRAQGPRGAHALGAAGGDPRGRRAHEPGHRPGALRHAEDRRVHLSAAYRKLGIGPARASRRRSGPRGPRPPRDPPRRGSWGSGLGTCPMTRRRAAAQDPGHELHRLHVHLVLDSLVRVHVDAPPDRGSYCVLEVLVPAGHMPPPHVHDQDAESFLVIEGEITLFTEAGPTVLRPGQSAHSPAARRTPSGSPPRGRRGSSSSRPRPASWATSAPSDPRPPRGAPDAGRPARRRAPDRRGARARIRFFGPPGIPSRPTPRGPRPRLSARRASSGRRR